MRRVRMEDTRKRRLIACFVVFSVSLAAPAIAQACTVSATNHAFGTLDPLAGTDVDSASTVTVTCSTATSYSIALSAGNGTYDRREMVKGSDTLEYNLYTDAARTIIWGDGSGSTSTVSGNDDGTGTDHTVYGRIPSGQNPVIGSYSDSIVATVTY